MDGVVTFQEAIKLLDLVGRIPPDTVWVEIGSERGEGSTISLAQQAERYGTVLHSVDISDHCQRTVQHPALTCHVAKGSVWTKNYQSLVHRPISVLHLDNFDWIWNQSVIDNWIQDQIKTYRKDYSEVMDNRRCQTEHLAQMIDLVPWLSQDCMIIMDDTFLKDGVWTGKCGAAAVYLETLGFEVVYISDGGTIMVRGFDVLPRLTLDGILCII